METLGGPTGDTVTIAARNLELTSELLSIASSLDAAGVPFVVLKGVPLAYRIFGRLEARRIRDNDILVPLAHVARGIEALRGCGYAEEHPGLARGEELRRTNQSLMVQQRPGAVRLCAELHWRAFYPEFFDVPEAVEWQHVSPFSLHGHTLRVFDEPLTLLHLAAHFAQHGFSQAWILRDVAAAWNTWHRDLDRQALRRLAVETRTLGVLEFALKAAQDLDWLAAPPAVLGSRRAAVLRRILPTRRLFEPRPEPDHRRNLLLFVLTGLRRAPRYLAHTMFPTIERMSVIYGRPASRRLYLRYATRPWRALQGAVKTPRA